MAEQDQNEQIDREWNEQGEYTEMYSKEEVYDVLKDLPRQVGMASDISDAIGCSTLTARNKLQELQLDRKVEKRGTGGRTKLWYIPADADAVDNGDGGQADVADVLADNGPETIFKLLSLNLGEAIRVGDTVYEDGDKHTAGES